MRSHRLSFVALCALLTLSVPLLRAQTPANAPSAQNSETKSPPAATDINHALTQALQSIQAKNFIEAQNQIARVESLDPHHQYLWATKGSLAQALGRDTEALEDFQRELAAFPSNLLALDDIAMAQWRLGKHDEAIATLQSWLAKDPHAVVGATHLLGFYHEMHRDDLVVTAGDRLFPGIISQGARSRQFLFLYARAQAAVGQTDHAVATFDKILDITNDPIFLNDAAFYLAEQGRNLPHAEAAQRKAVDELAHLNPAQAGVLPAALRTRLLIATWDTLGWILYREANYAAAEPYLRAAWRNRPDAAVGKHLGDLLVAQKKPAAALEIYELALASAQPPAIPTPTPAPVPAPSASTPPPAASASTTPANTEIPALQTAIASLKKSGAVSSLKDPAAAAALLSTLDLGPAGFMQGQDTYVVTFSRGHLSAETVQPHETLHGGSRRIENFQIPNDFLPDDSAWLTRTAILACKTNCTLTFLP